MYHSVFHPAFPKDLKRLDKGTQQFIAADIVPKVSRDPSQGIALTGIFRNLYKFRFHHRGVSYRLIYRMIDIDHMIFFYVVAPRGEVYKKLSQRLR